MALGKPTITIPRGDKFDPRGTAAALDAANRRLVAIEAILNDLPTQVLAALMQTMDAKAQGYVVRSGERLILRTLTQGAGVTITNPSGVEGSSTISAP